MGRKVYTGKVVSDKMDKTVVVSVTRLYEHPVYKKTVKKAAKFKVHDAEGAAKAGDTVSIIETRPLSKEKRWRVLEILRKG